MPILSISKNVIYRILKLWQSKIKTLPATIMIRCVLFHNDFGNSLCYNEFNLRYRTASTNWGSIRTGKDYIDCSLCEIKTDYTGGN